HIRKGLAISLPCSTAPIGKRRSSRWTPGRDFAAGAAGSGRRAVCGYGKREQVFPGKKLRKRSHWITMRETFPSEELSRSAVGDSGLLQGECTMAIRVTCPACHSSYSVADDLRGKKLHCRECEEPVVVSGGATKMSRDANG